MSKTATLNYYRILRQDGTTVPGIFNQEDALEHIRTWEEDAGGKLRQLTPSEVTGQLIRSLFFALGYKEQGHED